MSKWRRTALLHADNAEDISITGAGTIDGSGQIWWNIAHKNHVAGDTTGSGVGFTRPLLIDLVDSTQIAFDGITVQNSPMYNFTFFGSSYITITNVKINNPPSPNTDGIDPFWSSHIKIDHVTWDTGDDCVAIKSGLVERGEPDLPSFDITNPTSDCEHGHGMSVGSELAGGVHDVTMDNVTFTGTDAGIRIKSNRGRGNDIYNLHYSNITMTNVKVPIEIVAPTTPSATLLHKTGDRTASGRAHPEVPRHHHQERDRHRRRDEHLLGTAGLPGGSHQEPLSRERHHLRQKRRHHPASQHHRKERHHHQRRPRRKARRRQHHRSAVVSVLQHSAGHRKMPHIMWRLFAFVLVVIPRVALRTPTNSDAPDTASVFIPKAPTCYP